MAGWGLSPEVRLGEADDFAFFDEQTSPGGDGAVPEEFVAGDVEAAFDGALGLGDESFLSSDGVAEFGLAVFEAHGDIRWAFSAPEDVEVSAFALLLFLNGEGTVIDPLALEFEGFGASGEFDFVESALVEEADGFTEAEAVVEGEGEDFSFGDFHRGGRRAHAGGEQRRCEEHEERAWVHAGMKGGLSSDVKRRRRTALNCLAPDRARPGC